MKTKQFISLVMAYIKGDNTEAQAIQIQKNANAAVNLAISGLATEELKSESALEDAKEAYKVALFNNGEHKGFDPEKYIINLAAAERKIKDCKKVLADIKEKQEFLSRVSSEINREE